MYLYNIYFQFVHNELQKNKSSYFRQTESQKHNNFDEAYR